MINFWGPLEAFKHKRGFFLGHPVGSKLKNVDKWSHEEVFPEYNTQGAQNVNNQIYEKALLEITDTAGVVIIMH